MLTRCPVAATIPVRDLAPMTKFYGKQLGLELAAGSAKQGFLEFNAGGGTQLLLFQSQIAKPTENTVATFEVEDLAATMEQLRDNGVEFEEYDLPGVKTVDGVADMGGHQMAWVADPEGNVLALLGAGGGKARGDQKAGRGARSTSTKKAATKKTATKGTKGPRSRAAAR